MPTYQSHRADGWPLCPDCGEDELYSKINWNGSGERPALEQWIMAGMACYKCGWSLEPHGVEHKPAFRRKSQAIRLDASSLLKNATMEVSIELTGMRMFRVRKWLGVHLILLAARILNCQIDYRGSHVQR